MTCQNREATTHVPQYLAGVAVSFQSAIKSDEADIKFAQHRHIRVWADGWQYRYVPHVLILGHLREALSQTTFADYHEMRIRLACHPLGQPHDVVHVLRNTDVTAIEENHLVLKSKLCSVAVLEPGRPVADCPVSEQLNLVDEGG